MAKVHPGDQTRTAAIVDLEQAQAFLGLVLSQMRNAPGNSEALNYALRGFHHHATGALSLLKEYGNTARLDAMPAEGNA
ncbi:hypothetical protein [Microvirga sesbaniae]|uniref:hypothetical protein n=1 Tax=Microvirga sesbaniae TaxID=681392 RepID=UPI0021C8E3B2|nr:hypothetical protein [Microvirga sp. HBU67692]